MMGFDGETRGGVIGPEAKLIGQNLLTNQI